MPADDGIAVATGSSVVLIRTLLRILVFVATAVTSVLVYLLCRRMQRRGLISNALVAAEDVEAGKEAVTQDK